MSFEHEPQTGSVGVGGWNRFQLAGS